VFGRSQTYVGAAERGAVRLDGLQFKDWCRACGTTLIAWATEVEKQLPPIKGVARKTARKAT